MESESVCLAPPQFWAAPTDSSSQVHPLRIAKGTPNASPSKMASGAPRPLSEISPAEMRRNSPSWHQAPTNKVRGMQHCGSSTFLTSAWQKSVLPTDSSPFQSSPLENVASPRLFWQNRNSENMLYGRSGSPSPNRRSSIERLQRASRVKNSNILALEQKQEYDPTRIPQIERPLAKVQSNAFESSGSIGLRSPDFEISGFDSIRSDSTMSPPGADNARGPASKDQASPTKSSLSPSKFKSSFDLENGAWSPDSSMNENDMLPSLRTLHRHAKSVTFDAAPPQINEYEMATPDLSSIGTNSREGSYESVEDEDDDHVLYDPAHVDLQDESFDASLEDTDKTPVVGPDDWRGDSPMVDHRREPAQFEGSPMPERPLSAAAFGQSAFKRSDSTNSNGDHRPLPPLPGLSHSRSQSTGSAPASPGLSATAERMLGSHRSLPAPPPATASKSDIQNIGNGKMTLEERLKLMMLSDDNNGKTAAELQRERRLRRGVGRDRLGSPTSEAETDTALEAEEGDDTIGDISALGEYQLPPRISRESIMRRVNGNQAMERESDYNFSSPAPSSSPQRSPTRSPERLVPLDPDVPIPSTEDSTIMPDEEEEEEEGSVIITRAPEDERDDVLDLYQHSDYDQDEDDVRSSRDDDSESHYSDSEPAQQASNKGLEEEVLTPRATTPAERANIKDGLPNLGPNEAAFSSDFESYMLPKAQNVEDNQGAAKAAEPTSPSMADARAFLQRPSTPDQAMSKPEYDGSGWGEPEDEYEDDSGTPESVIHHPMPEDEDEDEPKESPAIPERLATIKASGSKLKTRVSATPADLAAMREVRRQVSHEIPGVPPIPERHRNRLSRDMAAEPNASGDEFLERHPSFKNRSLTLDLDLGLSLDQDFERVIEAQKVAFVHSITPSSPLNINPTRQASRIFINTERKDLNTNVTFRNQRGYLMRQNTKLVAASDKDGDTSWKARSAGNSPVKKEKERPQSWTVEPWNGQVRRKSLRQRPETSGPAPPLPGQESNAKTVSQAAEKALPQVVEEDINADIATPESGERGRLFVKVMGVKDLDLPIPKSKSTPIVCKNQLTRVDERSWFSLTLDNGVHCVTTAWLELARNAPIGQEFELVVPNDLEFQLTLNVKLEKPAASRVAASAKANKPKTSTFSRVFASPKKRKELELRQREEEERMQNAHARQRNGPPTAYELFSPLAAEDGSFGRSYVCLKEHENRCFGRPYMAEVACFNEWATEEAGFASSVKSKRGNTAVVRRAPYKVGKLELQLLFVPRPKNATDDDMPKSMNSCIRELKATEERLARNWEGHLSQQGGDCPVSCVPNDFSELLLTIT